MPKRENAIRSKKKLVKAPAKDLSFYEETPKWVEERSKKLEKEVLQFEDSIVEGKASRGQVWEKNEILSEKIKVIGNKVRSLSKNFSNCRSIMTQYLLQ